MTYFTIIGGGLAGMSLAWQLHWRGMPFRIFDRDEPNTSSKIAAGLINPITGKRLAVMPKWNALMPTAIAFYRRVEAETQSQCFHPSGMVRILKDDFERQRYEKRAGQEFGSLIAETVPDLPESITAPFGAFAIPAAARLDVNRFLEVSRVAFQNRIQFKSFTMDDDVPDRTHVFCTGIAALAEMNLPANCFQPAKGELLTIRVPGLTETRIVNHGVWLMPLGNELFRVGATYSWDELDSIPTAAAKAELIRKLKLFLKLPFEVLEHQAATRPILTDRMPMLGTLPGSPRIAVFNGLGSKGALLAPFYSQQLAEHLLTGQSIDAEVDVNRFFLIV